MSRMFRVLSIVALSIVLVNCPSTPKPPAQTAAAPVFTPAEGTYQSAQSMTIATATDGAEIRYTTDGTAPTSTSGNLYSGPIQVSETTTIAAIAYKTGLGDSPVAHATFTVTIPVASNGQAPAVTPAPPTPAPLTDGEVSDARNALARAREVDADYYDPDNFDSARQLLDEGLDLRVRDPATARARLSSSKEKADLAFTNSVSRAAQDMEARRWRRQRTPSASPRRRRATRRRRRRKQRRCRSRS